MLSMKEPASFEEFWPDYLAAHSNPTTRTLHVCGTAVGLGCTALAVATRNPRYALLGLVSAYGAAWASHALVEGNAPKTFSHPIWSLRGDFRMLRLALEGKLTGEAERVRSERPLPERP
jgi:hypothetical protein